MMETIHDQQGHILGYLDHTALSNTTRLPNGHTVGYGNTIAAFLVRDR